MRWTAALAAAVLARSAFGAPVTFSGSVDGVIDLTGPGQVVWHVRNTGGTNDGTPTGTCTNAAGTGLTVGDAQFSPSSTDAFDSGLTVWIDNAIFVSPDTVDVTGDTLTSGPVTMSGVEVTVAYTAMQDTPTLRTRIRFHNATSQKQSFSFKLVTPATGPSTRAAPTRVTRSTTVICSS